MSHRTARIYSSLLENNSTVVLPFQTLICRGILFLSRGRRITMAKTQTSVRGVQHKKIVVVREHKRSDGTVVRAHRRSTPN